MAAAGILKEDDRVELIEGEIVQVPLYARAGIPQVWLVDLQREHVEVFREPSPTGRGTYRTVQVSRRGERVAPAVLPEVTLAVDEILP